MTDKSDNLLPTLVRAKVLRPEYYNHVQYLLMANPRNLGYTAVLVCDTVIGWNHCTDDRISGPNHAALYSSFVIELLISGDWYEEPPAPYTWLDTFVKENGLN